MNQDIELNAGGQPEFFEGRIERLGWGAVGIARHADGRIILLRHSEALFPGELVSAWIEWKARHAEGQVAQILEPSGDRIASACPWSSTCGGCNLHEAAERGGELKRQMVGDLLAKQLGSSIDWEWHPSSEQTLRQVIQLHFLDGVLGYHARGSHEIVAIDNCPAAAQQLSAAIGLLREGLSDGSLPQLEGRWELTVDDIEPVVMAWHEDDPGKVWELQTGKWQPGSGILRWKLPGAEIASHASGFFQVTGSSAISFFDGLFRNWQIGGDRLHDLYGGCGLFSLLLAGSFHSFAVVDSSESSITSAVVNLKELDARCFHRDADSYVRRMQSKPNDVIIADPPRSGLSRELCRMLNDQAAGSLLLVGCDGAAFCRDIGRLQAGWRLERLAVADLFPWTEQCEFVALLGNRAN